MALTPDIATFTLLNTAEKFQEFFHSSPAFVTFIYKNLDGIEKTVTVPNIAKIEFDLKVHGMTNDELQTTIANFGRLGDNIVFGNGTPPTDFFTDKPRAIFIDKDTATVYTNDIDNNVVKNVTNDTLNELSSNLLKIGTNIIFGEGAPDDTLNKDEIVLYVDTTANRMYVVDDTNSWKTTVQIPQTELPVLTGNNSVVENNTLNITISNFNADAVYDITCNVGTFTLDETNGVIVVIAPNVDSNISGKVTVVATSPDHIASDVTEFVFTVTNVVSEFDQALINNAYSANEAVNNGWEY